MRLFCLSLGLSGPKFRPPDPQAPWALPQSAYLNQRPAMVIHMQPPCWAVPKASYPAMQPSGTASAPNLPLYSREARHPLPPTHARAPNHWTHNKLLPQRMTSAKAFALCRKELQTPCTPLPAQTLTRPITGSDANLKGLAGGPANPFFPSVFGVCQSGSSAPASLLSHPRP